MAKKPLPLPLLICVARSRYSNDLLVNDTVEKIVDEAQEEPGDEVLVGFYVLHETQKLVLRVGQKAVQS